MFDALTLYVIIGIAVGIVAFTILFNRWDLPGTLRKRFSLNTRGKGLVFLLASAIMLAILGVVLVQVLGLPEAVAQVVEGLIIGFNLALIPGIIRPKNNGSGSNRGGRNNNRSSNSGGRRSKG